MKDNRQEIVAIRDDVEMIESKRYVRDRRWGGRGKAGGGGKRQGEGVGV